LGEKRILTLKGDAVSDFGSTLFIVGAQILFSSTFLSMLGTSQDTHISDLAGSIHNVLFENININETIMTLIDRGLNFHGSR
tara:strand:+ start:2198 stop:2443 length:246 start_codon:yes stop_codon:yes gene_type:complete